MQRPNQFYLSQEVNPIHPVAIIGRDHLAAFECFCKYLLHEIVPTKLMDTTHSKKLDYLARLAPSIIIRGEIQLFNLDVPRFAVRVYLGDRGGFANLRRMAEVVDRLKSEQWLAAPREIVAYREPKQSVVYVTPPMGVESFSKVFGDFNSPHNVVADCLLAPPAALPEAKYDYVTADLGWAYGEGESFRGIPYVRGIRGFSGGACAQACAFMVTALLHDNYPPEQLNAGVHGLAEITAIVTPQEYPFLPLRGLRSIMLVKYFVATGHSVFQYSFGNPGYLATSEQRNTNVRSAFSVASVYVRSGFAPIAKVASPERPELPRPDKLNHAVVIIGASKTTRNHSVPETLIINDPSNQPFMPWTASHFRDACITPTYPATMFCVLPHAVKVPLTISTVTYKLEEIERIDGIRPQYHGVYELAIAIESTSTKIDMPTQPIHLTDFTLVKLALSNNNDALFKADILEFPAVFSTIPTGLEKLKDRWHLSGDLKSLAGRWSWIQIRIVGSADNTKITLWDAEQLPISHVNVADLNLIDDPYTDPESDNSPSINAIRDKYILATIELKSGMWHIKIFRPKLSKQAVALSKYARPSRLPPARISTHLNNVANYNPKSEPTRQARRARIDAQHAAQFWPLSPALISSCSATNLNLAFTDNCWPLAVSSAELYSFMHCDDYLLKELNIDLGGTVRPSITTILATIYRTNPKDQTKIILKLRQLILSAANQLPATINAISTYIPQLNSANPERRDEAMDAFCMIALIRQNLQPNHDIRTIKISAGSLVHGLISRAHPTDEGEDKCLFARRRSQKATSRILIKRLTALCDKLDAIKGDVNFSLALEPEPGPLCLIQDMPSLIEVAERIEASKSSSLKRRVGFTIDIAYCILAGMKPSDVFGTKVVAERICHFHISDHGIGCFGHAPLGDVGFGRWDSGKDDRLILLRDWITQATAYAYDRVTNFNPEAPRFSRMMSLELEAAESPTLVQSSVATLEKLIRQANAQYTRPPLKPTFLDNIRGVLSRVNPWRPASSL